MNRDAKSILNDVLGPVMRGPSSSHTAGAYRIATIACALFGERPATIHCAFDPDGSYAPTYRPLGVDLAFAAGVLGWEMTDARYETSLDAVKETGVDLRFDVAPLEHADHPNSVRIAMSGADDATMTLWAKSTGGGAICVTRVDDVEVDLDGKSQETVELGERRVVSPAIFYPQTGDELFASAGEMLRLAEERGISLGAIALAYEATLLGLSEGEVTDEMSRRYDVMRASVEAGLDDRNSNMPLTQPTASRVFEAETKGKLALGGPTTRAAARAMAVMHVCNSRGVVCAAPTGGSAGVLPGVLVTLEEETIDRDGAVRALMAASAIGLIMARRATFAAEIAGCQVEIGVAGAMAAAAVVEAVGGSARQAVDAAAIALQNTMGSVCDPVGGGCEIPCHTRNAVAAASAFTCADLILGGYVNAVPLDETIDASFAVGKALPVELRCTARGGVAIAPSAVELVKRSNTKGPP